MPVYLFIPDVFGGVTEANHKKWIEADSLQFGVSRTLADPMGKATNREADHPHVSEIHVSKAMDNSSLALWSWAVSLKDARSCKMDIVSTAASKAPFAQYSLEECVISRFDVSGSGAGMPHESFSLNFTKIVVRFSEVDSKMTAGGPQEVRFDLAIADKY